MKGAQSDGEPTRAVQYDAVSDRAERKLAGWNGRGGITYSPKSGRIFDFEKAGHALALYLELIAGSLTLIPGRPIYLIGITCHQSRRLSDIIRKAYDLACVFTNQPLLGAWKGKDGEYVDVVVPIAFNSEEDAKEMGKRYDQQTIIRIDPDGHYEPIKTD